MKLHRTYISILCDYDDGNENHRACESGVSALVISSRNGSRNNPISGRILTEPKNSDASFREGLGFTSPVVLVASGRGWREGHKLGSSYSYLPHNVGTQAFDKGMVDGNNAARSK